MVAGTAVLKRLVLFTGVAGTGKSTLADTVARDMDGAAFSFDWVMGALTPFEPLQAVLQSDRELFRSVAYALLTQLAEKQLRNDQAAVLDCVTRASQLARWQQLARDHVLELAVVECVCTDERVHRSRIEGRVRNIPGWAELQWDWVAQARREYEPLDCEKLVLDAIEPIADNLGRVRAYLGERT